MSDALESNKTLTELNLEGNHKNRRHTDYIHQQPNLIHSHKINRQQHWRRRSGINE